VYFIVENFTAIFLKRSPLLNLPRETRANLTIQYLTDRQGNPNAVVIAIAIWKQIFPENLTSVK